jgi:hypothetical protein
MKEITQNEYRALLRVDLRMFVDRSFKELDPEMAFLASPNFAVSSSFKPGRIVTRGQVGVLEPLLFAHDNDRERIRQG